MRLLPDQGKGCDRTLTLSAAVRVFVLRTVMSQSSSRRGAPRHIPHGERDPTPPARKDCCDREAMSFLATTGGISGEDVRDLMVTAVEYRFGRISRLPVTIEWLSDNGSCYIAGDTRSFACDIGLEPRTTPIESPQSNGMAEAFVRTIKRDYVHVSPRPDAVTVMHQLSSWFGHYNEVHPHKALGYRSPREFIAARGNP